MTQAYISPTQHQAYQNFPKLDTPLIEANGQINIVWYRLLITLWFKSGGSFTQQQLSQSILDMGNGNSGIINNSTGELVGGISPDIEILAYLGLRPGESIGAADLSVLEAEIIALQDMVMELQTENQALSYRDIIPPTPVTATSSTLLFDNNGAVGPTIFNLPSWSANSPIIRDYTVAAAQQLTVTPNGTDKIGVNSTLFNTLGSNQLYSTLSRGTSNLLGVWVVRGMTGGWAG